MVRLFLSAQGILGEILQFVNTDMDISFWHTPPLPFTIFQGGENASAFRYFPSITMNSDTIQTMGASTKMRKSQDLGSC